MQIAKPCMKSLPDHLAIAHHNRSNEGIGTNPPAPVLSQLQSSHQVRSVRACELGFHATD